jgi:hypothetical protein
LKTVPSKYNQSAALINIEVSFLQNPYGTEATGEVSKVIFEAQSSFIGIPLIRKVLLKFSTHSHNSMLIGIVSQVTEDLQRLLQKIVQPAASEEL